MTDIVHQPSEDYTSMLIFSEGDRFGRELGNLLSCVEALQSFHLLIAEETCSTTMLESIVSRTGKYVVVGAKLLNVFESLHGRVCLLYTSDAADE